MTTTKSMLRLSSIIKASVFIICVALSSNVFAEYYVVDEAIESPCQTCIVHHVYHHRYHHVRHHVHYAWVPRPRTSYQIVVYYYVPPCTCCHEWVPCSSCGQSMCGRSAERRYYIQPAGFDDPFMDGYNSNSSYYQDRATADDDAYYNPDMNINN